MKNGGKKDENIDLRILFKNERYEKVAEVLGPELQCLRKVKEDSS